MEPFSNGNNISLFAEKSGKVPYAEKIYIRTSIHDNCDSTSVIAVLDKILK